MSANNKVLPRGKTAILVPVLSALVGMAVGYFGGREHVKMELRQSLEGVATSFTEALGGSFGGIVGGDDLGPDTPEMRIGETLTLNGVELTALGIEQRHVVGIKGGFGEPREVQSKEEVLVLSCRITNTTEGQVLVPLVSSTLRECWLTDNFGNKMLPFGVPQGLGFDAVYEDQKVHIELKPGEVMETVIMAELPKVMNATEFRWTLEFVVGNDYSKDRCSLLFTRDDIAKPST